MHRKITKTYFNMQNESDKMLKVLVSIIFFNEFGNAYVNFRFYLILIIDKIRMFDNELMIEGITI